jgi:hypothetical protein
MRGLLLGLLDLWSEGGVLAVCVQKRGTCTGHVLLQRLFRASQVPGSLGHFDGGKRVM